MKDLAAINDWIALCEGKARYCRTLDSKDWAGYTDLFTEDCVLDVTEGTQIPVISGRDAAIPQIQSSIPGYGHYHERWARRNGQWKIAALKLTRLHIDVHPPQPVHPPQ